MHKGPLSDVVAQPVVATKAHPDNEQLENELLAWEFRKRLGAWYRKHARELPWRGVNDPYATWLSEIMLQQTRVATVIDRYCEFLERFPTLSALAAADEADVLALWSGLGYYRRARMLHRGAQFVVRELEGQLPSSSVALRTLPGVGEYTAAAIASIAFGESIAVVDGNVERVLLRILGLPEEHSSEARARLMRVAQGLVPPSPRWRSRRKNPRNPAGDHNQAMMELGATICLPKAPLCLQCPEFELCRTRGEHPTRAREKQKSRVIAHLLALRKAGTVTEVLLERRSAEASLMPGMLELPPLPLEAVQGREPALRIRHAITTTNYYVQIFSEGAAGAPALRSAPGVSSGKSVSVEPSTGEREDVAHYDDVFAASPEGLEASRSLMREIPASPCDLEWTTTTRLGALPLTGLARKVLQRLGVMTMPVLRVR